MGDSNTTIGVLITLAVIGVMVYLVIRSRRPKPPRGNSPSYNDLKPPPDNQQRR